MRVNKKQHLINCFQKIADSVRVGLMTKTIFFMILKTLSARVLQKLGAGADQKKKLGSSAFVIEDDLFRLSCPGSVADFSNDHPSSYPPPYIITI